MIFPGTIVSVSDNSGARKIRSIKTLNSKFQHKIATTGDLIVGVVKKINTKKKLKNGSIFYCLVIRSTRKFCFSDGQLNSFSSSSVVLLNKSLSPVANRVFGPVPGVLRRGGFSKILMLSQAILN